jgi:hypothetical protein
MKGTFSARRARFDENRFSAELDRISPQGPNALERLVTAGCPREVLIGAIQDVIWTEMLPSDTRDPLLHTSGLSLREMRTHAKHLQEAAAFLRRLIASPLFTPIQSGDQDDWLWLRTLCGKMDTASYLLLAWPPRNIPRRLKKAKRAALSYYMDIVTGKPHHREVSELIEAAYCAIEATYRPRRLVKQDEGPVLTADLIQKQYERADKSILRQIADGWEQRFRHYHESFSDPPKV